MKALIIIATVLLVSCTDDRPIVVNETGTRFIIPDSYDVTVIIKGEFGKAFVPAGLDKYDLVDTPYKLKGTYLSGDWVDYILDNRSLPNNGTVTAEMYIGGVFVASTMVVGNGHKAVGNINGYIIDDKTFNFFFIHTGLDKRDVLSILDLNYLPALVPGKKLGDFYMIYGHPKEIWNHQPNDYFQTR